MVFKSAKDFKEENAAPKPPSMKFRQAAKIADKNSRTIVKIQQLLELTQLPGYNVNDPDGHVMIRVDQLKRRLNRRLAKLAKWVDIPTEERQIEFRSFRSFAPPAASFGFPYSSTSVVKPADQFSTYDSTSFAPAPAQKPTSTAHLAHLLSQAKTQPPIGSSTVEPKGEAAVATTNVSDAVTAAPKEEFDCSFEIEELSPEEIAANKKE